MSGPERGADLRKECINSPLNPFAGGKICCGERYGEGAYSRPLKRLWANPKTLQ